MALLGDSAHAMQPNLGQGGCMAIEDGYQLGKDLFEQAERARQAGKALDPEPVLVVSAWEICGLLCLLAAAETPADCGTASVAPATWCTLGETRVYCLMRISADD